MIKVDYKRFDQTFVIRIDRGEEVLECLKLICHNEKVKLGSFNGLGAADDITLGLFNTQEKKYYSKTFKGDYEITSLIGNVSTMNEEIYLHVHATIGDKNLTVFGGHLNRAVISGTCEIVMQAVEGKVDRLFDEEVGLNLFRF